MGTANMTKLLIVPTAYTEAKDDSNEAKESITELQKLDSLPCLRHAVQRRRNASHLISTCVNVTQSFINDI